MSNESESTEHPKPPETWVVAPDFLTETRNQWENFFNETLNYLGYDTIEKRSLAASLEHYALAPEAPEFRASDNRATFLVVNNRVVASVIEWRDEYNYAQVGAATYLTEELIEQVRFRELHLVQDPGHGS